ncbi:type II toxin-antitoxin system RelE/ParE family toxin [Rhodospirillum centenum]|uniref:Plasmid stabilization system protein n=1 Tax=Rhodospirillum centenum (strain ATCC 51521 / SW) TaxID=414684 RepID=B6IWE7_RHOCS|nr:type II toxin-antitoxin system RelE/ParE family toxin [Rhodospirillum centenum]ACJ00621.1 conserved hypothetical protein [Rhodospirillum centenum SW]
MRIVWTRSALRDAYAQADYIARSNPLAAARLLEDLLDAADGLVLFPDRGRPGRNGTRELTLVPPFVMVYAVDRAAGEVRVLRVWHGAQQH